MEILCYKGGMQAPPTLTAAHLPANRQSCTLCCCSQAESVSGQAAALPPRENLETQTFHLPVNIYSPPGNRLAKQTPEFKLGVRGRGRGMMSHYNIKISLYIPAVSVGPNWGFIRWSWNLIFLKFLVSICHCLKKKKKKDILHCKTSNTEPKSGRKTSPGPGVTSSSNC